MMTEADEVAESLAAQAPALESLDEARRYVRRWMPDESEQVVDNGRSPRGWCILQAERGTAANS